jgi:organic hydroperoxide reductase OsmC/OhrA
MESSVKLHRYAIGMDWTGNDGTGTATYKSYRRDHIIQAKGKPDILGSSDPAFRGSPERYTPEELLVASLSACHMLWYLHLCSTNGISVLAYTDAASGEMRENEDGSGEFVHVTLRPQVTIAKGGDTVRTLALHHEAHRLCFIARSVNFPVETAAEIIEA